ncbi:hypothetical protein B0H11DRAFT_2366751 [Mycena galericulata]|nr:hypothetical protein B0H11DRAFT_2366751 [Mycena galericulata]
MDPNKFESTSFVKRRGQEVSAFTVQIYFASRVHRLTRGIVMMFRLPPAFGIYIAGFLAILQISAGIAQAVLSYGLHSYSKLGQTASTHFVGITILQTAGSFACDMVITVYLCYFLAHNKNEMSRSNTMLNTLMVNAINRGMLTALSSGLTLGLFLGYRETFWFLLSLAPNSKLYMNSMLAMLNMRQHVRDKIDQGWDIVDLNDAHSATNASS